VSGDLPAVNSLCRVILDDAVERPSRVESDDEGLLTLAAPWHAAALAPGPGELLAVRWSTLRGISEVTATVVAVDREDAVPLWRVAPQGEVRVLQRRRFVRADAAVPATVAPVLDGQAGPMTMTTLVNLSEGGARCRVDGLSGLVDAGLAADGEVELRMSLDAELLLVVGIVIRIIPDVPWTARDCGELVLAFEASEQTADKIRRFVMHQQLLARRAALK
jgi:c-di-GMP-binding flagellar brake protein YcgR